VLAITRPFFTSALVDTRAFTLVLITVDIYSTPKIWVLNNLQIDLAS